MAISGEYSSTLGEYFSKNGFNVQNLAPPESNIRHDLVMDLDGNHIGYTVFYPKQGERIKLIYPIEGDRDFFNRALATLKFRDYCTSREISIEADTDGEQFGRDGFIDNLWELTKSENATERQLAWEFLFKA